jgi:hypothetical protein
MRIGFRMSTDAGGDHWMGPQGSVIFSDVLYWAELPDGPP